MLVWIPGYLFALAAGFSFGAYLVATRWAASSISPLLAVTFQTLLGTIVLAPFAWQLLFGVDTSHLWLFVIIGGGSATANMLTITANKYAPATLLAPLVYTEIVAATLMGYWVLGDIPLPQTWLGISIIVFAGLILIKPKQTAHSHMLEATIHFFTDHRVSGSDAQIGVLFVVFQSSFSFRNCLAAIAGLMTANLIWLGLVATGLGLLSHLTIGSDF